MNLRDQLVSECNKIEQDAEAAHAQRCKDVDFRFQEKYEGLMEEYRHRINILKVTDPDTMDVLRKAVAEEIKWLEAKIDLLIGVDSPQASGEMNRIVPRHVRLLDQLMALSPSCQVL